MPLQIKPKELLSRVIRANLADGKSGSDTIRATNSSPKKRKLNLAARFGKKEEGGLLKFVWNTGATLAGWIGGAVKFISFSATTIFSWLVSGTEQLKAFNWNASDKELTQSIASKNVQIAALWGGVLGQGAGWLAAIAVGYGISFLVPVVGGALLAKTIAVNVAAEGLDEFLATFKNAIAQTIRIWASGTATTLYINYRKFVKSLPDDVLERIYGRDTKNFIKKKWGSEGQPVISFNQRMDEVVESNKDPASQAFVEEFLEEAWDSFVEGGFIIAQTIDEAFEQAKLANKDPLGPARTVEITPDKQNENEKIVFQDLPQNLAVTAIQQTINTHRLLYNRDMGQYVGLPMEEYLKAQPQTLRIVVQFFSVPSPPWVAKGDRKLTKVTLTIPDIKKSALDWERIKAACGGANGYLWGRFRAIASLSNGRSVHVYGGSEQEAETRLKALLELSNATILTLSLGEQQKEGVVRLRPQLYKETVRVYPAYFTILNREEFLDPTKGKASKRQSFRDKRGRIDLWTNEKPNDYEEIVRQILTKGSL